MKLAGFIEHDWIDHCPHPIQGHRSKVFDKNPFHNKLADLGVKLGDLAIPLFPRSTPLRSNTSAELLDRLALPHRNLRTCLVASSTTVSWPLIAANAILALN